LILAKLAKDSAIYGGADFLTKILSFLVFPFIAAALSTKAFGLLELILTITALVGMIVNCGLNSSVQRFYWDKDTTVEMQQVIVTSGYSAQIVFGVIFLIIGFMFLPFLTSIFKENDIPISWITLISALFLIVFMEWIKYALDVIRLHFTPWKFFFLAMQSRVLVAFFGLYAVVFLGLGIDGFLVSHALGLIISTPLAIWFIRKDINLAKLDLEWVKELVKYGYPFIYAGLAFWLFSSMDRWMLASMNSFEEVGIYSVASRLSSIVFFFSMAFGQAWSPIAIKIRTDYPEEYRDIYGQVLVYLIFSMSIVGGGLALFSGEAIYLLFPSEFLPSAMPMLILCFSIVLQSTMQVTAAGISIEKKTFIFARVSWFVALVNFILNYILIPEYGASGAATATLISYFILTISYLYFTQKLHPMKIPWFNLIILVFLVLLIAIISMYSITYSIRIEIIIMKFLFSLVCLIIGFLLLPFGLLDKKKLLS
tara:strand:+ start:771 stop:2216 length:1446 start_codon:yes stop_codon:yes gene_type:complete